MEPVDFRAEWRPGGDLSLTVEDKGIGIAGDKISLITGPFYQTDTSMARAYEGSGLGLYLVSQFMKLHGGTLNIESELGSGTRATVRSPASRVIVEGDADREIPTQRHSGFDP